MDERNMSIMKLGMSRIERMHSTMKANLGTWSKGLVTWSRGLLGRGSDSSFTVECTDVSTMVLWEVGRLRGSNRLVKSSRRGWYTSIKPRNWQEKIRWFYNFRRVEKSMDEHILTTTCRMVADFQESLTFDRFAGRIAPGVVPGRRWRNG